MTDTAGTPVAGATTALELGGKELQTTTGEDGSFEVEDVPVGEGQLTITAPGFKETPQKLAAKEGLDKLSFRLEADLSAARIRGTVRSFGGKALRAQVSIDPPGITVETDKSGYFQVDVEPGTHAVTIRAQGYVEQKRSLEVEESGVVVFNADLTKQAR